MNKYPPHISEKRRPIKTPRDLVVNGQALFGTFDEPIPNMNLLDCVKPAGMLPHFMNKVRLTVWEAFEINMDEGTLVSAVYNIGIIGFSIFVWYDRKTKKAASWVNFVPPSRCEVAPNLISSTTRLKTRKSFLQMDNAFQDGLCHARGNSSNRKYGSFAFDMRAERLSPPSVVSIPFDNNKPLYSEKDFFKGEGFVRINGETYKSNRNTVCIVDDHKGYYPFHAHYDWLTTMGRCRIGGREKYLAFNLTRNQSINQDDYNENVLWLEGTSSPLPPVYFEHIDRMKWHVTDDYGTVDIMFHIDDIFPMMVHLGFIDISYTLPFGILSGYVKDINGKKYVLDGMTGIGEDKTTRL